MLIDDQTDAVLTAAERRAVEQAHSVLADLLAASSSERKEGMSKRIQKLKSRSGEQNSRRNTLDAVAHRHGVSTQTVTLKHASFEVGGRMLLLGSQVHLDGTSRPLGVPG